MSDIYAIGTPMGDATYTVRQSGAGEWQISGGLAYDNAPDGTASGYITQQWGTSEFRVDVDDSGAESMITGTLSAAVDAFASMTRMVEATTEGRAIAARWQSPGAVGSVLAQLASTGRARLDMLTDDAERTKITDPASLADMENLLTEDYGYREPVTVRSLTVADVATNGVDSVAELAQRVFDVVADRHPHLITDAASARDAFADIWTVWSDES